MSGQEARDERTPDIEELIQTSNSINAKILPENPPTAAAVQNYANGLARPRRNIQATNMASVPVLRSNIPTTVN